MPLDEIRFPRTQFLPIFVSQFTSGQQAADLEEVQQCVEDVQAVNAKEVNP